ncbi:MAG: GWxTD domain-containing protein [Candidatus Aminicenantes bacterium]|nr:GWxTD domain-containing protein [Candidatus Aminicenantes bacterium]
MKKSAIVIPGLIFVLSALFFFTLHGLCQEAAGSQEKKAEPLSKWSKQWLEEVVPYIITPPEKKIFIALLTEEDRGNFMESFWRKRDPNPQTPENEYKIEYYKRIAWANKFLGNAGIAGWRTDRGRIYILLGPPNEIQRDMTSSSYSSNMFHGPKEVWNYYGTPSPYLPYNMEFAFVDKLGTGGYVLENSVKMGESGADQVDIENLHFQFDYQEQLAEAMKNPFDNLATLKGIVTTQVSYNHIPFRQEMLYFKESNEKIFCPLVFSVSYAALPLKKIEDKYYYSLSLVVNVSDDRGKIIFEGTRDFNFNHGASEMESLLRSGVYQGQCFLSFASTARKIRLLLLDNFTGKMGTFDQDIVLSDFGSGNLQISDIVPYLQGKEGLDISPEKFERTFPRIHRVFRPADELSVYFEVYNLALDRETGKNNLQVEYAVWRQGKLLTTVASPAMAPTSEKDCRIQTAFKLVDFQPGAYVLKVTVRDIHSGKVETRETSFSIVQ